MAPFYYLETERENGEMFTFAHCSSFAEVIQLNVENKNPPHSITS
jgi:hypothetical protein